MNSSDSTTNTFTYRYQTYCIAVYPVPEVPKVVYDTCISKAVGRNCVLDLPVISANIYQRVTLPGTNSNWAYIIARVPKGYIFGSLSII